MAVSGGRGRGIRLAALAAAVVIVVIVGVFAVRGLLGKGTAGAATPENAVSTLVSAVQARDLVAIAGALNPYEVRQLTQLVDQIQVMSDQAGITTKGQELAAAQVNVVEMTYRADTLSARVARVTITGGQVTLAGIDSSKLPPAMEGLKVEKLTGSGSAPPTVDFAKLGSARYPINSVMVVKEDGGWFVSPLYTALDYAARSAGVRPVFSDTLSPATTETAPELAVQSFIRAFSSADIDSMLSRLVPQEQAAARAYAQLWRPSLDRSGGIANGRIGGASVRVAISRTSTSPQADGSVAVAIDAADVTGNGETFAIDGGCVQQVSGRTSGGPQSVCLSTFLQRLFHSASETVVTNDSSRLTFVAVPSGNGYAVSLIGSGIATARSALASRDAKTLASELGLGFAETPAATLSVGQQVSVDVLSGNVALTVSEPTKVVLTSSPAHVIRVWHGDDVYPDRAKKLQTSDGTEVWAYDLPPGTYRLYWYDDLLYGDRIPTGNITISAVKVG